MPIRHRFNSTVPDGGDASLVRPSNWNDTHVFPWRTVTVGETLAASDPLNANITTTQNFPLPVTIAAGDVFSVRNYAKSTAGALVRVVTGAGRRIRTPGDLLAVADDLTCAPGETISLVALDATNLDLVTPGAVGPAGPSGGSNVSENLRALVENAALAFRNNPRTRGLTVSPPTLSVGTSTPPAAHTRIYTFGNTGAPFVSSGGRATTASGRTTFPVVTPSGTRIDFCWRVETIVDSDSVGFLLDSATANGYRFIVDGQYTAVAGTTSAAGSERYYRLVWPTKARRRVIVEGNPNLGFWGAAVPDDGQCILPDDTNSLRMFIVGDSNLFHEGFSQKGDNYGFALGDYLGIRDTWCAGISSTGFSVAGGGNNYAGRRADWSTLPSNSVDLLVFQLSYNDYNASVPDATLQSLVAAELTAVRAAHPAAVIVVIGNNSWNDSGGSIAGLSAHETAAAAAVTAANDPLAVFLPIYTAPGQHLPITGQSAAGDTGTGNTPRYVSHAADHMNPAGNIYFGEWLARRMIGLFANMAGLPVPALSLPPPAAPRITVGTTAPSSPAVGDIWIDTN